MWHHWWVKKMRDTRVGMIETQIVMLLMMNFLWLIIFLSLMVLQNIFYFFIFCFIVLLVQFEFHFCFCFILFVLKYGRSCSSYFQGILWSQLWPCLSQLPYDFFFFLYLIFLFLFCLSHIYASRIRPLASCCPFWFVNLLVI